VENLKPINPLSLKTTLTLRYDVTQSPTLQKLTWKDLYKEKENISINILENTIKKNIFNSINESDPKNIAISLSGGIDSSLVLLLLKEVFPNSKINAFSIKFSNSIDETIKARDIANHVGVSHKIISVDDYFEKLPLVISRTGLPFWDIHWYYVAEQAKPISNYLVSGDGGDELFGGYTFRYSKFLSLINPNSTPQDKIKAYLECHLRDHVPDQSEIFAQNSNFSWSEIYDLLIPYFDNPLNPLEQLFLADYNGKLLYNFSIFNNKILESFKIKSITPLISNEMINYSNKMDLHQKYNLNKNVGKLPLRKILEKYKMMHFFDNEKLGFSVNTINLWKNSGNELCKNYLLDSKLVQDSWISEDWILKHIHKKELEIRYINKFFGLLAFEIWYRIHITHEMNSNSKI
jgi:asparagine synthase (glutamine-hydrolysing)